MVIYHDKGKMVKVRYVNVHTTQGIAKKLCNRTFSQILYKSLEKHEDTDWVRVLLTNSAEYIMVNDIIYRINLRATYTKDSDKLDTRDNFIMPKKDDSLQFSIQYDSYSHNLISAFKELSSEVVINN